MHNSIRNSLRLAKEMFPYEILTVAKQLSYNTQTPTSRQQHDHVGSKEIIMQ